MRDGDRGENSHRRQHTICWRSNRSPSSMAARCAPHFCSSICAAPGFHNEALADVEEKREERNWDASPTDKPSVPIKASRVGFWFLDSSMGRVMQNWNLLSVINACGVRKGCTNKIPWSLMAFPTSSSSSFSMRKLGLPHLDTG